METEVIRVLLPKASEAVHLQDHIPYAVNGERHTPTAGLQLSSGPPFSSGTYAVLAIKLC